MSASPALVLVTTSFPLQGDGREAAGAFVADLAVELARSVPVRVVAPGARQVRERLGDRLDVFRFAAPDRPLSTLSLRSPADVVEVSRVILAGRRATLEAVRAGPTAHQLALWALPSGDWARHASAKTGVPYSVWTLGSDIWSLGRIPVVRQYLRRVLRGAAHCFSDGVQLAEDTRAIGVRDVAFLPSVAAYPVPRARAMAGTPPYRLVFLGRWHPNKGIDLLLDALALLDATAWARIADVRIAGGGPLDADVRVRVETLQAAGHPVRLDGFLDRRRAAEALNAADFLLLPSRIESIPLVYADAMRARLPVVAMPVGDLPSLVTSGTGELAQAVDPGAFADAIRRATLAGPPRYAPAVAAAAASCSVEAVANSVLAACLR